MMAFSDVRIPYGAYWSTPFARWQMSFADLHSLKFAALTGAKVARQKNWEIDTIDHAVLGFTVPQEKCFWGVPWVMSMMGLPAVSGPAIAQACATSARCVSMSASELSTRGANVSLIVTCDRTSNSPLVTFPNPRGTGGVPSVESWLLDNFKEDPNTLLGTIDTAENCARDWQISTEEQHDLVSLRYEQYRDATKQDSAFLRRFMPLPFSVPDRRLKGETGTLEGDQGIHETGVGGLASLKPLKAGGTVTYAGQTHPADGNAGMILTTKDRVGDFTTQANIDVRILAVAQARARAAYMPEAPVKASKKALDAAGLPVTEIDVFKTHNPFIVNDIVFARETGVDPKKMNNYGCSLVYGHPQGPTGLRLIIEMIEELVVRGGGLGLFNGCSAGDTGMAVILSVDDASRRVS